MYIVYQLNSSRRQDRYTFGTWNTETSDEEREVKEFMRRNSSVAYALVLWGK